MLRRYLRLESLLMLLPVSLLIGTNVPVLAIGDRTLYVGSNELVIGLLLAGLLVRKFRGAALDPLPVALTRAAALYTGVWLVSVFFYVFWAGDFPSAAAVVELVRWCEFLLVFPLVYWLARTEKQVQDLMRCSAIFMLLNVLVGIYQLFTLDLGSNRIYGLFVSAANRDSTTAVNANITGAAFMGGALFFLAFALAQTGRRRRENIFFMTLCVVTTALTISRSAMLGVLMGMALLSVYYRDQWKLFLKIGLTGLGALLATVAAFNILLVRLLNTFQMTTGTVDAMAVDARYIEWEALFWPTLNNILLGVGHGDIFLYIINADSYYVSTFALMGAPGIAALVYLLWQIFVAAQTGALPKTPFARAFKHGFLACYLGFLVTNAFAGVLYNPRMAGLFWMLTAMLLRTLQPSKQESPPVLNAARPAGEN